MASQPSDPSGPFVLPDPPYTGWHVFLAKLLERCADPDKLLVKTFDKLGDLMLEADATVLRKDALGHALFFYPDLDFLSPILRLYSVLEYKSPQDRLTWDDLDQGRIYGLLCKRKYHRVWDSEIAVIFLTSAVAGDFYDVAEKNGFVFGAPDKGIRCCRVRGPGAAEGMAFYVVNLIDLGQEYPDSLLNLLSARRHLYHPPESGDGRSIMARDLFYAILSQELRKMMEQHKNMPGLHEVTEDLEELRRRVMAMHTVEERLAGIPPEQRLVDLSEEQRTALLELLLKERSTK